MFVEEYGSGNIKYEVQNGARARLPWKIWTLNQSLEGSPALFGFLPLEANPVYWRCFPRERIDVAPDTLPATSLDFLSK